ncbi:MAG: hypothetical protein FWD79_10140 [Desulfobulbus sp.]|nr:hypothetical protein [Desulfobulbus sp.]
MAVTPKQRSSHMPKDVRRKRHVRTGAGNKKLKYLAIKGKRIGRRSCNRVMFACILTLRFLPQVALFVKMSFFSPRSHPANALLPLSANHRVIIGPTARCRANRKPRPLAFF